MHLSDLIAKQTPMPLGWMGVFGTGNFKAFLAPGIFTFEAPAERCRVRVLGGGGSNYSSNGVVAGGTSSFSNLISATGGNGGSSSNSSPPSPGQGFGGDFQASGGTSHGRGGGAAGSQLGDGGSSYAEGGAAVGGMNAYGYAGASAYGQSERGRSIQSHTAGPDCFGRSAFYRLAMPNGYLAERFPFDLFQGMGGGVIQDGGGQYRRYYPLPGGSGAGGAYFYDFEVCGGHGGGGGGSLDTGSGEGYPANGGFGAGAGASKETRVSTGGAGAGYAHGLFSLVKGGVYQVTVAQGGKSLAGNDFSKGGDGLVIVEW